MVVLLNVLQFLILIFKSGFSYPTLCKTLQLNPILSYYIYCYGVQRLSAQLSCLHVIMTKK